MVILLLGFQLLILASGIRKFKQARRWNEYILIDKSSQSNLTIKTHYIARNHSGSDSIELAFQNLLYCWSE